MRLRGLANPRVAAVAVALAVILIGGVYALQRTPSYQSSAALVLVPTAKPAEVPTVLDSFTSAGTSGTFVELISSPGTLAAAGAPPIAVTVRAVPDTRVIDVTATGAQTTVQAGLARLLAAAETEQTSLGDMWKLQQISSPTPATRAGASTTAILAASILLALVAAAATLALLGRRAGAPRETRTVPLEPMPNGRASGGRQAVPSPRRVAGKR